MTRTPDSAPRPIFNYENLLLVLPGLSFGFAFFDRNSASVLIPYILMMAAAGAPGCVLCFFLTETAPAKARA